MKVGVQMDSIDWKRYKGALWHAGRLLYVDLSGSYMGEYMMEIHQLFTLLYVCCASI